LRNPENDGRQHDGNILRDIGVSIIEKLFREGGDDVFENQQGLDALELRRQGTKGITYDTSD
jgi:hypothetical protein